jgi:hypothetical protein
MRRYGFFLFLAHICLSFFFEISRTVRGVFFDTLFKGRQYGYPFLVLDFLPHLAYPFPRGLQTSTHCSLNHRARPPERLFFKPKLELLRYLPPCRLYSRTSCPDAYALGQTFTLALIFFLILEYSFLSIGMLVIYYKY